MPETYIHPSLRDQGYTGATGNTPYKPATPQQLEALRQVYDNPAIAATRQVVSAGAVVLNVNFDGTHNNGAFPAPGETETNISSLTRLQRAVSPPENTLYLPGVGAQTVPAGTVDAHGWPAAGSSPSLSKALPFNAGAEANAIVEQGYRRLVNRVEQILAEDPNAVISLNVSGFSRGAAQATALANLLNERGIPGYCAPGDCRIASLLLLDPVDMTRGQLNTTAPNNVDNTLVLVATQEGRAIMPAMPVSPDAVVIGVPAAHADVGGSFNAQGISAVTLKAARDFLLASGVPVAEIPADLQADWSQMRVHNSGLDRFGNTVWSWSEGARYHEGDGLGAQSVQDILDNGVRVQATPANPAAADAADYKVAANPAQPDGEQLTLREVTDRDGRLRVVLLNDAAEVLLEAPPGSLLNRDPVSGVITLRPQDGGQVTQYDPQTRSVSAVMPSPVEANASDDPSAGTGSVTKPTDSQTSAPSPSADREATDAGTTPSASTEPSDQAPDQTSISLIQLTQGAALLSSVVGLQHWGALSEVQRLASLSGLYNQLDHIGSLGSHDNLPGDLGSAAAAFNLLASLEHGNTAGVLMSGLNFTNALADNMASEAIHRTCQRRAKRRCASNRHHARNAL